MEKEIDDLASSLVDKILQSYITEANSSPLSSVGNYNDSDQEVKKSLTTGVLLPGRKRPVSLNQINSRDRSGRTLLHKFVANGDLDITESLLKAGASVQIADYAGWTPLHEACLAGHTKVVELLLAYEADVDAKGGDGDTPLHDAIGNGHVEVVQLLLKHGANLNLNNQKGKNPEEFAAATLEELLSEQSVRFRLTQEQSSPSSNVNSTEVKNAKRICEILKTWKDMIPKVVERNADGQTLFHLACSKGDLDEVKSLLEYGSDINAADNSGWTPAHNAALNGHDKVLALLLKYGSTVDPVGMEGETPLHDAVANGHAKCVNLLLKYGADVLKKNGKGKTPRDLAREDHEDIRRLVNFPREHWEPIMKTEYYPRQLRDSSKIPEEVEESTSTETVKEAQPSQNNSFSWGGLDQNGVGDFESEREKKKFQALLKSLSQEERNVLEGSKSTRTTPSQPSKEKETTNTPRPRGRPPGAKNIKTLQKSTSKERRKSTDFRPDTPSTVKRPASAGPNSEPKRSKSSINTSDIKKSPEIKKEVEKPKPKEVEKPKPKPRPPKPVQPAPISKLHIALAEMKEDDGKLLKKKKRFAISGYQAVDSSTEVSSESIVTDTSSIPVTLPEPVKTEPTNPASLPSSTLFSVPMKKTVSEKSTIVESNLIAEKEKEKADLETKYCLPLCAYIKPDENNPYFRPTKVSRENMWGSIPKVNHSKVFIDMQLAYCLGLNTGHELLQKYPKLQSRVATTHEKTALEETILSNRLLKSMLLKVDRNWIKIKMIDGVESAVLGEIDIHVVSWNEELYRILNTVVIDLEKRLGAPINWLEDMTWPAAPEDPKDPSLAQASAKVYVHKLKRHKPR